MLDTSSSVTFLCRRQIKVTTKCNVSNKLLHTASVPFKYSIDNSVVISHKVTQHVKGVTTVKSINGTHKKNKQEKSVRGVKAVI